jgi:ribosomal protein S18 acetylase RimI-like enzyme
MQNGPVEIVPFDDEHVDAAAELLATRHARDREAEPLLPQRYENSTAALEEIGAAWRSTGASGSAALRGGRLVGYLVGAPREVDAWGENIWVELGGHAVEEPEDARDLYGHAAARWVEEGRNRHYALVPASAPLVDAWFRVGFGQQQAHGYCEIAGHANAELPEGCEIREPTEADIDDLIAAEIDLALPRHQQASPVFSMRPLPGEEEIRKEWADTLSEGEEKVLLGYREGRPVALWAFVRAEASRHFRGLGLPDAAYYLAYAVTLPEARRTGLGVALTEKGFSWAAEQGYTAMVTDWRVTNLLASRFWPRRGFRASVLRLYRSIP